MSEIENKQMLGVSVADILLPSSFDSLYKICAFEADISKGTSSPAVRIGNLFMSLTSNKSKYCSRGRQMFYFSVSEPRFITRFPQDFKICG